MNTVKNMETFKVVIPDLDLVLEEFNTIEEANEFVNKCIEWDKKHPQGYIPYYEVKREEVII